MIRRFDSQWPVHAFRRKGGTPGNATTYAPPAPPTASNAAAVQAAADAKQKAMEQTGLTSTILGGQAASASGSVSGMNLLRQNLTQQRNTLLGGG
jgi:hypothetical protein